MIKGKHKIIKLLKHQKKFAELPDTYSAMIGGFEIIFYRDRRNSWHEGPMKT